MGVLPHRLLPLGRPRRVAVCEGNRGYTLVVAKGADSLLCGRLPRLSRHWLGYWAISPTANVIDVRRVRDDVEFQLVANSYEPFDLVALLPLAMVFLHIPDSRITRFGRDAYQPIVWRTPGSYAGTQSISSNALN